ncbi:hypothetical protein [Streptomyces sp. NBC_00299]|nr:hypothetical protein [Streptomyces sp. NBC_00299]
MGAGAGAGVDTGLPVVTLRQPAATYAGAARAFDGYRVAREVFAGTATG